MCEWRSSIRKFSGITTILQVLYYKLQILQVLLPICYKILKHPTCVDLILSNTPRSFPSTCVIETEPSDFHLMTLPFMTKSFTKFKAQFINYSSYKNFSNDAFRKCLLEKLSKEVFVNNNYELQRLCDINLQVLIHDAPQKIKYVGDNQMPFMTKQLSKEILNRSRFCINFLRNRTEIKFFIIGNRTISLTKI